jgi:putative RecB family exonuclease
MTTEMKIKNTDEEIEKPNIEILKLSASSMKTYDQCPKKYFYNYIAKEERKQWAHFDLGNLCHRALEIFHQIYMEEGTDKRTLSKIMSHSFAEARKEFEDVSGNILVEAKALVQDYLKSVSRNGMPLVKGVETSFNFNLEEDILIRGFLDRVDILKDGRFHIVDYKTTKNTKYLEPFQLLIYGMWLQREYPHVENFKASYILLRHGSKLKSYDFNSEDIIKCKKKIIKYANSINTSMNEDVWAPIPGPLCNWCDFQKICPTQQGW